MRENSALIFGVTESTENGTEVTEGREVSAAAAASFL